MIIVLLNIIFLFVVKKILFLIIYEPIQNKKDHFFILVIPFIIKYYKNLNDFLFIYNIIQHI